MTRHYVALGECMGSSIARRGGKGMYPRSRAAQHSAGENRRTRRPVLEYMTIDEVTTSIR